MSDPNIFFALDEANMADSATGSLAATKGTSVDVKAYGRDMMKDHHALRKGGQDLARKLNVTPQPAAGDNGPAVDQALADSLAGMAAGLSWDKFYLDHAVTHHEMVLMTAQNALSATQSVEVRAMLTKAAPIVQNHLDKAKGLQAKSQ